MASVLLTGFPGLLGSKLVERLLLRYPNDVAVNCLIQPAYRKQAEQRVLAIEALDADFSGRIRLFEGDITQPDLGLGSGYGRLNHDTTEIYHLAAVYRLAVARDLAMQVNVVGTQNMLNFAEQCPLLARLHYVSTCFVSGRYSGVFQETDLDVGQSFNNAYEETKFLAEVAVQNAMLSGLPATIYRPGIVTGDSRTGATQKYDGIYYWIHWLLHRPRTTVLVLTGNPFRRYINMVPSDFVIDALAYISARPDITGRVYHLADPNPPRVVDVARILGKATGRRLVRLWLPFFVFSNVLKIPFLRRFSGVRPETLDYFNLPTRYATTNARAALAGSGIECPPFASYAHRLVEFMQSHPEIPLA